MKRVLTGVVVVSLAAALGSPAAVLAEEPPPAVKDASTHFQRGVEMFRDKDYRGALVEFRRANELSPNWKVLYNVGKTYLELKEYAPALTSLEAYLRDGGANVPADRRQEVERLIAGLQARVGHVQVQSNAAGAEVRVDDQLVGTTPLSGPILLSAGQHRLSLFHPKYGARAEVFDLASGDRRTVHLDLLIADEKKPDSAPASPPPASPAKPPPPPPPVASSPNTPLIVSAVAAGVLTGGAVVTGVLAFRARDDYDRRAGAGPLPVDDAASLHRKVTTLAAVTDGLAVAAVLAGGLTLYFAVRPRRVQVGVGPAALQLRGSF